MIVLGLATVLAGGCPKSDQEARRGQAPTSDKDAAAGKRTRQEVGLHLTTVARNPLLRGFDEARRIWLWEEHRSKRLRVYIPPKRIGVIRYAFADGRSAQLVIGGVHRTADGELAADHCHARTDWFIDGMGHSRSGCSLQRLLQQQGKPLELGSNFRALTHIDVDGWGVVSGDSKPPDKLDKDAVTLIDETELTSEAWETDSGHWQLTRAKQLTPVLTRKPTE